MGIIEAVNENEYENAAKEVRCPDCGKLFFKILKSKGSIIETVCPRCKSPKKKHVIKT